jgi:hypothetical protein
LKEPKRMSLAAYLLGKAAVRKQHHYYFHRLVRRDAISATSALPGQAKQNGQQQHEVALKSSFSLMISDELVCFGSS